MKRPLLFLSLTGLLLTAAGAQDKTTPLTPSFSGTSTLRFGDENLWDDETVAKTSGLSSEVVDTTLKLTLKGGTERPATTKVRTADGYSETRDLGWEVGAGADLGSLFSFTANTSKYSTDSTSSRYSLIQPMIDWYETNKARYGLPANPYGSAGWPTTAYGGSSGRYQFIRGTRVEPTAYVAWSLARWTDADALFKDVYEAIADQIESLASAYVPTGDVSQFDYASLDAAGKKAALNKQRALRSWRKLTEGSTTSASLSSPKLSSAFVQVTNLFTVLDARADFLGATLSTGELITSPRAAQADSGARLGLGLAPGVVPGFTASVAANAVGAVAATAENWDTTTLDYDPGTPAYVGLKAEASYRTPLTGWNTELLVEAEALMPDAFEAPGNFSASLGSTATLDGELSAKGRVEADLVRWSDRWVDDPAFTTAAALGLEGQVEYLGLRPHGKLYYKAAGFGGTSGNLTEDRLPGTTAADDFAASQTADALLVDAGLRADLQALVALRLVWVDAGLRALAHGTDTPAYGWYTSVGSSLRDWLGVPVTLDAKVERYTNSSLVTYEDYASFPAETLWDGMNASVRVSWSPIDALTLSVDVASKDTANLRDDDRVISANGLATIKF